MRGVPDRRLKEVEFAARSNDQRDHARFAIRL